MRSLTRKRAAVLSAAAVVGSVSIVFGNADSWKAAANGSWETGSNWVDGSTPGAGDTANFNLPGSYTVTFGAAPLPIRNLSVLQGNVTMNSILQALEITSASGADDLTVSGATTTLTLGTSGSPVSVNVGSSLFVQSGATLQVLFNSSIFTSATGSCSVNGTLRFNGNQILAALGPTFVGSGGDGTLLFQNGVSPQHVNGLTIGGGGSSGTVAITGGAQVPINGSMFLANDNAVGSTAVLNINGTMSQLTQSVGGLIEVGSSVNGSAVINVGINATGGVFSDSGFTSVNPTGTVNVGTAANSAIYEANGNFTITGGTLNVGADGNFNLASSGMMIVENGGQANFLGDYFAANKGAYTVTGANSVFSVTAPATMFINDGASFTVGQGGQLLVGPLSIATGGNGTLLVDGANSAVVATGTSTWGLDGNNIANVTFADSAVGTLSGDVMMASSDLGAAATLNIQSAGVVHVGNLLMCGFAQENQGPSQATINITDPNSALIFKSGSALTIGDVYQDPAIINVSNNGVLTVGAGGTTTLNQSGVININGGTANLQTLIQNGGSINFTSGALSCIGNLNVGLNGLLGQNVTLGNSRILTLTGTTTIDAFHTLTLNGGTFNTGSLVVNGTFAFTTGNLGITGASGLTVGANGPFGSVLELISGQNLSVTNTATVTSGSTMVIDQGAALTVAGLSNSGFIELNSFSFGAGTISNSGLIRGSGVAAASGTVTNTVLGEIRADSGDSLQFRAGIVNNAGRINLFGGGVEFTGTLNNTGTIAGQGTLMADGQLTNSGTVSFSGGTSAITGVVQNNKKITVTGNSTATFFNAVTNGGNSNFQVSANSTAVFLGLVTNTGAFTGLGLKDFEAGASGGPIASVVGNTLVGGDSNVSSTFVHENALDVDGVLAITPGRSVANTSRVNSLVLSGSTGHWQGKLDLADNDLILDYTGDSPIATIADEIKSGYASGNWNGTGITSAVAHAQAAAVHKTALGYADASSLGISTFDGQAVDNSSILVRYTYYGDANLDGVVNALDFNAVATNFGAAPGKFWNNGDFNYDGFTNTQDFTLLASNFGQILPSLALASLVPEPGSLILAMAAGIFRRRRGRA